MENHLSESCIRQLKDGGVRVVLDTLSAGNLQDSGVRKTAVAEVNLMSSTFGFCVGATTSATSSSWVSPSHLHVDHCVTGRRAWTKSTYRRGCETIFARWQVRGRMKEARIWEGRLFSSCVTHAGPNVRKRTCEWLGGGPGHQRWRSRPPRDRW